MLGTCIRYDRVRAFGFIAPDNEDLPDFFVCPKLIVSEKNHRRYLLPGFRVEFEPFDVEGRPQARNVRIIARTVVVQRSAAPGVKS
jgi:cold shock CspA family protein